jgi:hypothetical protein
MAQLSNKRSSREVERHKQQRRGEERDKQEEGRRVIYRKKEQGREHYVAWGHRRERDGGGEWEGDKLF